MEELVRSLALFRPEIALTAGLLLVVVVDSTLAAWRDVVARVLCLASLAVALGFAFNLQAARRVVGDLLGRARRRPARGRVQGRARRRRRS